MHRLHPTQTFATTTRSSDLLIRDFASINLRQHRASCFFLHHHSRRAFHAGTTESLRLHVESHDLGDKRWRDEGVGLKITGYQDQNSVKVGDALPLELDEGDGQWRQDDWTAEVDVVAPEGLVASKPDGDVVAEGGSSHAISTANAGKAAAAGVAVAAALAGHSTPGGTQSRAESRLARRQRRELAGRYKPDSAVRKEQTEHEEVEEQGRDSVLAMIEKMDGPALPKATDKAAKAARRKAAREDRDGKKDAKDTGSTRAARLLRSEDSKNKKVSEKPVEPKPIRENWQIQKSANMNKFGEATWQPRKRLSPDTLEGIRALHASDPVTYSTETLSNQFQVSPENIRRILKSKWRPNDDEREAREKRWERRGVRKWTEMAALGERPPKRWRDMGVGSVKGEPERRPGWKRGGNKSHEDADDVDWEGDGFGERIL